MANSVSIDALRPELWQKELYADVMDNLYMSKFMGEGKNNIVQIKSDLKKGKGDTVTLPLTAKLTGNGVTGDSELEGNEEARLAYSDSISIDQIRHAVRLTGRLDEKKNVYDMRMDAKDGLSVWMKEFVERQFFFKLAGVNNTSLTDVNGVAVAANCAWSNAPVQVPYADTAAGYGDRYLCADYANGADSLATTDLLTPELISRAKAKAKLASPKISPLMIEGKEYFVLFVHPWQAYELKNNATYAQAQREAQVRGDSNPIFTGALGVWDGVVIHEHEYVPFLDISVAGHNFNAAAAGTDISADCFRALLCGQQALGFVQTADSFRMVEKEFDYDNQVGYATSLIGGIQKITFNSKDYGVIAIDTAATSLV